MSYCGPLNDLCLQYWNTKKGLWPSSEWLASQYPGHRGKWKEGKIIFLLNEQYCVLGHRAVRHYNFEYVKAKEKEKKRWHNQLGLTKAQENWGQTSAPSPRGYIWQEKEKKKFYNIKWWLSSLIDRVVTLSVVRVKDIHVRLGGFIKANGLSFCHNCHIIRPLHNNNNIHGHSWTTIK